MKEIKVNTQKAKAQETTKRTMKHPIKIIDSIYRTFISICMISGAIALTYCAMKHVDQRNWKIAVIVPAAGLFTAFIVEMIRLNSKDN